MKKLLLILSFTLGLTTAASSAYYNDRSDWNELGNFKQYYVMGLFDEISLKFVGDDPARLKYKDELQECIIKYSVNSKTLADLVDNFYQDVANWTVRPRNALLRSLDKFCKF